jgi:hypothetical protein
MEEFFANKPASTVPVPRAEEPPAQETQKPDAAYTAEVDANAEPESQAPVTNEVTEVQKPPA